MKTAFMKANLITMMSAILLAGVSAQVAQAQGVVGTCVAGTQYATIQAAVNAVQPGTTIKVCPGGYPEQVVIEKPLTLEGIISGGAEGAWVHQPTAGCQPTRPARTRHRSW